MRSGIGKRHRGATIFEVVYGSELKAGRQWKAVCIERCKHGLAREWRRPVLATEQGGGSLLNYMGDGWAIEARGFDYGVVRTRVSERGWRRWFELPGCKYSAGALSGDYVVTATALNVRSGPGTDYEILDVVHNGDMLSAGAREGWTPIELPGRVGWVSDKYIEVVD